MSSLKEYCPTEWLRPQDLEKVFGISQSTQAKYRMRKAIPYHQRGKFIFYDRQEIDEWIREGKIC